MHVQLKVTKRTCIIFNTNYIDANRYLIPIIATPIIEECYDIYLRYLFHLKNQFYVNISELLFIVPLSCFISLLTFSFESDLIES